MKTDVSQAAERAKGKIEESTTGMIHAAHDFGTSIAAEASPLLARDNLSPLQGAAATYTSDPSDAAAYAAFLETFNAQDYTGKVHSTVSVCSLSLTCLACTRKRGARSRCNPRVLQRTTTHHWDTNKPRPAPM